MSDKLEFCVKTNEYGHLSLKKIAQSEFDSLAHELAERCEILLDDAHYLLFYVGAENIVKKLNLRPFGQPWNPLGRYGAIGRQVAWMSRECIKHGFCPIHAIRVYSEAKKIAAIRCDGYGVLQWMDIIWNILWRDLLIGAKEKERELLELERWEQICQSDGGLEFAEKLGEPFRDEPEETDDIARIFAEMLGPKPKKKQPRIDKGSPKAPPWSRNRWNKGKK